MKRIALIVAAAAMTTGFATTASAASGHASGPLGIKIYHGKKHAKPSQRAYRTAHVTRSERRAIARSKARLNRLKRRVRRDGRVTRIERKRVKAATARHHRLVRRAHHN